MLRNLASSLFLTERDADFEDPMAAKVRGRVVTTLHKAKEVRPLVERCITIARRSLQHAEKAEQFAVEADRGTAEWKQWRSSDQWQKWCDARAPVVAARRRALQLLGDKEAVQILFDEVAPRFADRAGGYTRVLRLADRRVGDAGERAILEFVGVRDRITLRSEKPSFGEDDAATEEAPAEPEASASEAAPEESGAAEPAAEDSNDGDAEAKSDK